MIKLLLLTLSIFGQQAFSMKTCSVRCGEEDGKVSSCFAHGAKAECRCRANKKGIEVADCSNSGLFLDTDIGVEKTNSSEYGI